MAKHFSKKKYQTEIISRESFEIWKERNPEFENVDYGQFLKYYKHLRNEIFQSVIDNPAGVDLPFFLGNISVRILDIDFKCAKDFNTSLLTDKETGAKVKIPFITSDIPKKPKIVWKKHKLFSSLPSVFGTEIAKTCTRFISAGIRNNLNRYQKAFNLDKVPSKCEDEPEKSLFDLA